MVRRTRLGAAGASTGTSGEGAEDRFALLIAPTGAGKTLAGFLPTLVELSGASLFTSPCLRGEVG